MGAQRKEQLILGQHVTTIFRIRKKERLSAKNNNTVMYIVLQVDY